jgi:uncharacterized protein
VSRDSAWLRYDAAAQRLSLTVHIQPNSSRTEFAGLHGNALKIRVAAPAADNKANAALIAFLGKSLGIPKSAIALRHGATGRRKVVEISGGPELEKAARQLT